MITWINGVVWDMAWNRSTTLVSLIVIHIYLGSCSQYETEFRKFLVRFRKPYWNDTVEYRKRLEVFELNYKIAQYQNLNRTDNTSAWFGITKFSDMTFSEFKAIYLSDYIPSHLPHVSDEGLLTLKNSAPPEHPELPQKVDWAFSSVELLESRYAAKTNHLQQFSIQEMIDCSRSIKTPFGNLAGCEGGQLCAALFWLNETQLSVVPESKYKYRDHDEYCRIIPKSASGIKLKGYKCFNYMNQEEEVLRYLATQGPVSVAVDASNWHNYLGGIIQYHCPPHLNHAVQIVGYDLTGPVPYYIVRNSWGKNWGLDGYVHIKYGENMCGIASEVTMVTDIDVS